MKDKSKILDKEWCSVITTKYGHLIQTPLGEVLKGIIITRVTDACNDDPKATVIMQVNLVPHDVDLRKNIKALLYKRTNLR